MASVEVVDLGGKLVCPPFCDTHLHLDYVFTARKPGAVNESGTLFEGIQRWSETKADLTVDEIKERAKIGIAKEMRLSRCRSSPSRRRACTPMKVLMANPARIWLRKA